MTTLRFSDCPVMVRPAIVLAGLMMAFVLAPRDAAAQGDGRVHLRLAVVVDRAEAMTLRDRACNAAPLLNLFGCGAGSDGAQTGARAGASRGTGVELAAGVRLWRGVRVEAAASHQPGLEFRGNANFVNTGDTQPVRAPITADSFVARGVVDLGAWRLASSRVAPFVAVGIGGTRNRVGTMDFEFPGLPDQPSTTTTRGGRSWHRTWDAGVGVRMPMAAAAAIEAGYRYQDLGHLDTAGGPIAVVRGTRVRVIDGVAGTRARLRVHRVYAGARLTFQTP